MSVFTCETRIAAIQAEIFDLETPGQRFNFKIAARGADVVSGRSMAKASKKVAELRGCEVTG
jgi:hypothetical protein